MSRTIILVSAIGTLGIWTFPTYSQEAETESQAKQVQAEATGSGDPQVAITIKDPKISVEELQLLLKPLTVNELENEVAAWQSFLKSKVQEVSNAELVIKKNWAIEQKKKPLNP